MAAEDAAVVAARRPHDEAVGADGRHVAASLPTGDRQAQDSADANHAEVRRESECDRHPLRRRGG